MAWGTKTQISDAVNVNSTTLQDASTAVELLSGEVAHVQVQSTTTAATSSLLVHVQATLDPSTEAWDTIAYGAPIEIPSTTTAALLSFTIQGVYKFRLIYNLVTGTQQTNVSAWYRKDGQ